MIVIDASLALDLVLVTSEARDIAAKVRDLGDMLAAPELIDLEFLQALRRQVRLKHVSRQRADETIELYRALPLERFGHRPLAPRVWALRDNLTAYDAAYFALAELLDAPLWTRDEKFLSAPGHRARVKIL